MSISATIIEAGPQTTVQDAGRFGARQLGVPQAGAADRLSFALANRAAGNHWAAPALECTMKGPSLRFEQPTVFAVGGADMSAELNGKTVPLYSNLAARPGDELRLNAPSIGLRTYIAIAGGVAGDDFFSSVSTYMPAKLGGLEGRALRAGDQLCNAGIPTAAPADIDKTMHPRFSNDRVLRAIPGPEAAIFAPESLAQFFSQPLTATRRGDRMGVQLKGAPIAPPTENPPVSSPVFPGTVQCPPGGDPFLLLADAQTTGGYARIAQIIDADIHLAGQIKPGDHVWFSEVNAATAREITRKKTALYSGLLNGFHFG